MTGTELPNEILGRPVLFGCLTGSHNYNLNTETSDRDYHVFVCPTFDDLYRGNVLSKQCISDETDLIVYDVRRIPELIWKSNPSFVEMLFTKEPIIREDLTGDPVLDRRVGEMIGTLFGNREEFARMNLPYLWDASMGTFHGRMRNLNKSTEGTADLVSRYGYNTKQAMHAIRGLWVLERYAENGFASFADAIWFEGADREYLLSVKNGSMTMDEAVRKLDRRLEEVQEYKGLYKGSGQDLRRKELLDSTVEAIVEIMISNELGTGRRRCDEGERW